MNKLSFYIQTLPEHALLTADEFDAIFWPSLLEALETYNAALGTNETPRTIEPYGSSFGNFYYALYLSEPVAGEVPATITTETGLVVTTHDVPRGVTTCPV
jgi:hypothetical protein